MTKIKTRADRPTTGGREYHLHTRPRDLAPLCLEVGAPERARMIAEQYFERPILMGDHRGLKSYTGTYEGERISVVTTGMGAPSTGIVLPEAYRCGGRIFIRVGSCFTLLKEPKPGDVRGGRRGATFFAILPRVRDTRGR